LLLRHLFHGVLNRLPARSAAPEWPEKNEGSSAQTIGPSLTAEQQDLAAGQLPGDWMSLASDGKQ
jgi:hypothetical protein